MANIPTVALDETSPAGTQAVSLGDDRLREFKTQVRELVGVDHDFPSSGQATDNGQHLRCTFQEQANLGTGAVGTTILGSQTTGGRGELTYTNEDDADIQLTSGAYIGSFNTDLMARDIYSLGISTLPTIKGVTTFEAGGALDIGAYDFRALSFTSDQITGTAPFVVSSTTKVTNLNADLLDGYNSSLTTGANVVVVSDTAGQLIKGMLGNNIKAGTYTGDGAATNAVTIATGFQPSALVVWRKNNDGYLGIKNSTDSTGAWIISTNSYYQNDHIVSLDANGFTVGDGTGSTNAFNVSSAIYGYIALGL